MDSLRLVAARGPGLICPGHGPWITDPPAKIGEYLEHRESRERALVEALEEGERSRMSLLEQVWSDVPDLLRPAAAVVMEAHLQKLGNEGLLPDDLGE
jgi:glyoxylase-like metal-dependent hydrolase (beta-lactamase superfamily II)